MSEPVGGYAEHLRNMARRDVVQSEFEVEEHVLWQAADHIDRLTEDNWRLKNACAGLRDRIRNQVKAVNDLKEKLNGS